MKRYIIDFPKNSDVAVYIYVDSFLSGIACVANDGITRFRDNVYAADGSRAFETNSERIVNSIRVWLSNLGLTVS